MQFPWYKVAWSYLFPIVLEETGSYYNPIIEVYLKKGRLQLVTRDAIYSYDDWYINFRETFQRMDWQGLKGQKVLLLGLGLGSVPFMLEKVFKKNFEYTAIEIDPEICRLASVYALPRLRSFIEVINTDGYIFTETDKGQYDLIIMDIFQSAVIPEKFQSAKFLEILKNKLNAGGLLLYNRMYSDENAMSESRVFLDSFKSVFPAASHLIIRENMVIISDHSLVGLPEN